MGGTTFYLSGKTEREVKQKITERLREARNNMMYEDRRSNIVFSPREQMFFAILRVHT